VIAENAAKRDIVEQLIGLATSIGCTFPQLAIAFTLAHPAATSTTIGRRTMQHLEDLVKGAAITLDDATLDRIDEIVPPGTNRYSPNAAFPLRALTDAARRRSLSERAAA
jgi:aryl-alcohol dehydrogenase-like predicted oxidoreductase